jgi:large repetitive protein
MTLARDDLGVLGDLAEALGLFVDGQPNADWLAHPDTYLVDMLANGAQRQALMSFVDEALGGAERDVRNGVTWLPIVQVDDIGLTASLTIDERPASALHIGLGLAFATRAPAPVSRTTLHLPLFRTRKQSGGAVSQPLLLGSDGGRITIAVSVTLDAGTPVPGQPRIGSIGLDFDFPTAAGDSAGGPRFGIALLGLQMPGAASPVDVRVAADSADTLDDALLDLVLMLVRAQADAAGAPAPVRAAAGLLGLRSGDQVPDFPIAALATQGLPALSAWMVGIVSGSASRRDWLGHLAGLLGATPPAPGASAIAFDLGGLADLTLGLAVETGPTGHTLLTPQLGLELGNAQARIEARADLFRIDLATGAAIALPRLGVWAAAGTAAQPVLNVPGPPPVQVRTLRVGFALDAQRRMNFVLAADQVQIGTHGYPVLDLTSPDAVMDAVGSTVAQLADQIFAGLGDALDLVRTLVGLTPPAGVPAISVATLMADPLPAVTDYWRHLVATPTALRSVLTALRGALADASEAVSVVDGDGSIGAPWRLPLVSNGSTSLNLELVVEGTLVTVSAAAASEVDTLGQRCTVVSTRLAAHVARIDLQARSAQLMPGASAVLTLRERGASPRRARLALGPDLELLADHVGVALGWSPFVGLRADIVAPNPRLVGGGVTVPVVMPAFAADGSVVLPPEAWDAVQLLVGLVAERGGGLFADVSAALGWAPIAAPNSDEADRSSTLPLSRLVDDPATAIARWLPALLATRQGQRLLAVLGDAFSAGAQGALAALPQPGAVDALGGIALLPAAPLPPIAPTLLGRGTPRDPYRVTLGAALPELWLAFTPDGPPAAVAAAGDLLRRWRPGDAPLAIDQLAGALVAEATQDTALFDLLVGRPLVAGMEALVARWIGGDGRIVAPTTTVPGVSVATTGLAAGQLWAALDLEDTIGRTPTTTVHVAIGAQVFEREFAAAPANRRIDLTAAGVDAAMLTLPAFTAGEWFVALGTRAACLGSATGDGTAQQAERLQRVLAGLAPHDDAIAVVAIGGAGHAARLAAQAVPEVADVLMLGTPLAPIALSAVQVQPVADALRLAARLLPPVDAAEPDDDDLALGRALVGALTDVADLADPGAELRLPAAPFAATRGGLTVTALFGQVAEDRVRAALTAIVAAGLAGRAQARAARPGTATTGLQAGLRWALPASSTGTLAVAASGELALITLDAETGASAAGALIARLRVTDRIGWIAATPQLALRAISAELVLPLDGVGSGRAQLVLHDARIFGQDYERLVLGNGADALPALPEARALMAAFAQRLVADLGGGASLALRSLLQAAGLLDAAGALVTGALDQLLLDPAALVRQRLATAGSEFEAALASLLGTPAATVDLAQRRVRVQGGAPTAGRFGWRADVTVALPDPSAGPALPAALPVLTGQLAIGPDAALPVVGGLQLQLDFSPLALRLVWHHAGGGRDEVPLWPTPDPAAIARLMAQTAPGFVAQAALELLRGADEAARPVVDAVLDALGLLGGAAGDAQRALRPLHGLVRDPAGWLRSARSLAASPARIQALFDSLRPLLGVGGAAGSPLPLVGGVTLAVSPSGTGARLALSVDPTAWGAPAGATGRLALGLAATLDVFPSTPPQVGMAAHMGLTGGATGRQAVHAAIGASGLQLFLRPATGPDVSLVPFGGLGALGAAAQAALPFVLDQLAAAAAPVGPLVGKLGDALALRTGAPRAFDGARLQAWAADPVGALGAAVPAILAEGLATIRPLVAAFVPPQLTVTADAGRLTLAMAGVSLGWSPSGPSGGSATLTITSLAVPGIERLAARVTIAADGLRELSATLGPAAIAAGGLTLRPFISFAAGTAPAGGRRVALGMAVDDTRRFALRWLLDGSGFALVASNGTITAATEVSNPQAVALRLVEAVIDLAAAVALAQQPVRDLLAEPVGASTVRELLAGVLLVDAGGDPQPIAGLLDPTTILDRAQRLFANIADAAITISVTGGLEIAFLRHPGDGRIGVRLGLSQRFALTSGGDIALWLENDDRWIRNDAVGDGGVFLGLVTGTPPLKFQPSLSVDGVGLRIGRHSGPLLEAGLSIDSIALHVFAGVDHTGFHSGGVQLAFANLAVATDGAGGSNGIAQGVMRDTGPTPPKPAFSPALAIQKHRGDPLELSLRAGDPPGPWWIAIQRGFGPLYIEQVGFDAPMVGGRLQSISLLMDGSMSLFGLTAAVDDLQITYFLGDGNFFDPKHWRIDLAGLAVSADMAGVSLVGGLLKQKSTNAAGIEQIDYLGMLLGRFAVYGLTVYGGYGEGVDDSGQKFTAFFAVGAVNGPIGGPPAFFLTGIGGGFGINRKLRLPDDLAQFGQYPLIKALDVAASTANPMDELRALGSYFPMSKGTFWFAAGLSFNSFALVDGIAVVGVQIGDGLDISLMGLARMALPRPQVALVSIELALLVRFSSSEGVLWVQGQLTDNSWLLYEDVKLTGGFAYVLWFKGEHAGEFVTTMGGYHPDFKRAGYPVVPRLGLRWSIGSNIVIKAGSYFALTSEAVMAGGDFEVSATLGPAWAELKFGAHGIVYFDPFRYKVEAYVRIAAGITIDTWLFGEITISVSLGARVEVQGPEFRGRATFEVGPVELTVEFGGPDRVSLKKLSAEEFIGKYLEMADDGSGALIHAVMTDRGALPAKGEDATPDGSAAKPYVVVVEFTLTFTSTVPVVEVQRTSPMAGAASSTHNPSGGLHLPSMQVENLRPVLVLTWLREVDHDNNPATPQTPQPVPFPMTAAARPFGRFPKGVWGEAGDINAQKVPKAEMIDALNELVLDCSATPSGGGPEIPYHQVEINKRKPLPFSRNVVDIAALRSAAASIRALLPATADAEVAWRLSGRLLARTSGGVARAAFRGERAAPPRLGALTEGLESAVKAEVPVVLTPPAGRIYDHFIDPPVAVGLLASAQVGLSATPTQAARTTVKDGARLKRVQPPTLAAVMARRSRSIAARLVLADASATPDRRRGTLVAAAEVPTSAIARAPAAVVARAGAPAPERLDTFTKSLSRGATLAAGECVVLRLPNAKGDVDASIERPQLISSGAPVRIVCFGIGGGLIADEPLSPSASRSGSAAFTLPPGAATMVAVGLGDQRAQAAAAGAGLLGWHAGQSLPYVGHGHAVGAGCTLRSDTEALALHAERRDAGWVRAAELAAGTTTLVTRFAAPLTTLVIAVDDPAAGGAMLDGRQLLMGLDGAERALGRDGEPLAPQVLVQGNRSIVAYALVPIADEKGRPERPSVTIASEPGWSVVAVAGHAALSPEDALARIAAHGLEAALTPLVARGSGAAAAAVSRLQWIGPRRSDQARRAAQAAAVGIAAPARPAGAARSARAAPVAPAVGPSWTERPFEPDRNFDELVAAAEAALPRAQRRPTAKKTRR